MFSNGLSLLTLVETGDALGAFPVICMLVLYFDDDVNTSLLVFWKANKIMIQRLTCLKQV